LKKNGGRFWYASAVGGMRFSPISFDLEYLKQWHYANFVFQSASEQTIFITLSALFTVIDKFRLPFFRIAQFQFVTSYEKYIPCKISNVI
jgi:hypothetical protein